MFLFFHRWGSQGQASCPNVAVLRGSAWFCSFLDPVPQATLKCLPNLSLPAHTSSRWFFFPSLGYGRCNLPNLWTGWLPFTAWLLCHHCCRMKRFLGGRKAELLGPQFCFLCRFPNFHLQRGRWRIMAWKPTVSQVYNRTISFMVAQVKEYPHHKSHRGKLRPREKWSVFTLLVANRWGWII